MANKEYKIGKTFHIGLTKLRVETAKKRCEGCYFIKDKSCMQKDISKKIGFCDKIFREDRNDVVFVKVEK